MKWLLRILSEGCNTAIIVKQGNIRIKPQVGNKLVTSCKYYNNKGLSPCEFDSTYLCEVRYKDKEILRFPVISKVQSSIGLPFKGYFDDLGLDGAYYVENYDFVQPNELPLVYEQEFEYFKDFGWSPTKRRHLPNRSGKPAVSYEEAKEQGFDRGE